MICNASSKVIIVIDVDMIAFHDTSNSKVRREGKLFNTKCDSK